MTCPRRRQNVPPPGAGLGLAAAAAVAVAVARLAAEPGGRAGTRANVERFSAQVHSLSFKTPWVSDSLFEELCCREQMGFLLLLLRRRSSVFVPSWADQNSSLAGGRNPA